MGKKRLKDLGGGGEGDLKTIWLGWARSFSELGSIIFAIKKPEGRDLLICNWSLGSRVACAVADSMRAQKVCVVQSSIENPGICFPLNTNRDLLYPVHVLLYPLHYSYPFVYGYPSLQKICNVIIRHTSLTSISEIK